MKLKMGLVNNILESVFIFLLIGIFILLTITLKKEKEDPKIYTKKTIKIEEE